MKKSIGSVHDVFHAKSLARLRGPMGIGHVRYPTAGCSSEFEAQPFFVNSPYGICLGHNGNLPNTSELAEVLTREDLRHLNTTSDSEVLLNVLASELSRVKTPRASAADIFSALSSVYRRVRGGFAVVAMIVGHGLLGFRDPHGIRPLQLGKRKYGMQEEYMIASESTAFKPLDFEFVRDVRPGEVIFIDRHNKLHAKVVREGHLNPCMFEWVYLAAPDSTIDGVNVYKSRVRMGEALASQIRKAGIRIDSIIPIPDTGRPSAAGLADKLKIRYREGFVKNRYIGRTFIMPGKTCESAI
jgi:amidophosphoribosyltransferase